MDNSKSNLNLDDIHFIKNHLSYAKKYLLQPKGYEPLVWKSVEQINIIINKVNEIIGNEPVDWDNKTGYAKKP